ncbi:DUF4190 domain-containing protein [Oerskovia turbata]|uniref:DUF4190 domain-containing protein n=2 Tax=Oerskovia turbata TaxID=1713 RepID=A0A4Q1KU33_9CELL|nr:DUF4190 domain-containing protein [Oerskovia turbata]RXR33205.1 DUF4190 domain-containing protein [Oerskovia turbata]
MRRARPVQTALGRAPESRAKKARLLPNPSREGPRMPGTTTDHRRDERRPEGPRGLWGGILTKYSSTALVRARHSDLWVLSAGGARHGYGSPMTTPPPQDSGTPDQDPFSPPVAPYAPSGASRQPPLVPYRPPYGADEAPGPYAAPGTPVYGTAPEVYGAPTSDGGFPPQPTGYGPGHPVGYGPGHPSGYGPQPGWSPAPSWNASFAPLPRQNGLALASMITSLAGLLLCMVPGIVGLVLGIVALQQIGRDGTTGRGFAITGVAVGAVGTAFVLLWFFATVGTW